MSHKPSSLTLSIIQCDSRSDQKKNITKVLALCDQAIKDKTEFICLPEMFHCRGNALQMLATGDTIPGSILQPFMDLAKQHQVFILAGSICEKVPDEKKVFNSSVLINDKGEISAIYRKIHLFNVKLEQGSIDETITFKPGSEPVMADLKGLNIGLSVCYDLRFPELYRTYAEKKAEIITVPASFTKPTGEAHWEVLLRARAIENQCFIVAPNQAGVGAGDVPTYGNSMIIDPWGKVLGRCSGDQEEVLTVTISLDKLAQYRKQLPSLEHRQL